MNLKFIGCYATLLRNDINAIAKIIVTNLSVDPNIYSFERVFLLKWNSAVNSAI